MKSRISAWGGHFGKAIAMFCLLMAPAAQARLNIQSCTLTSPFGMVINTNLTSNLSSTTSFLLSCKTNGHSDPNNPNPIVTIKLNLGTHASGVTRRLDSVGNKLSYQLFQDSTFNTPWDETTNFISRPISGDITNEPITIYGKLDGTGANLDQPVGTYTDTIQVMVGW